MADICRCKGWNITWDGQESNRNGVAILSQLPIEEDVKSGNGRWIKGRINQQWFMSIYAPADAEARKEWWPQVWNVPLENTIIGGDWNVRIKVSDSDTGKEVTEDGHKLLHLMSQRGLVDAFQDHGVGLKWTFVHRGNQRKSRLDYWLVEHNKQHLIEKVQVVHHPASDHFPLELLYNWTPDAHRTKGTWRLDRKCLTPAWCHMIQEMASKWPISSINDWWELKEAIKEEAKIATQWMHYEQKSHQRHLEHKLKKAMELTRAW